jgi:hypothetical protein
MKEGLRDAGNKQRINDPGDTREYPQKYQGSFKLAQHNFFLLPPFLHQVQRY